MYQLLIEKQVHKQLDKILSPDHEKIKTAIIELAINPRPTGYKKLKGRDGYLFDKGITALFMKFKTRF